MKVRHQGRLWFIIIRAAWVYVYGSQPWCSKVHIRIVGRWASIPTFRWQSQFLTFPLGVSFENETSGLGSIGFCGPGKNFVGLHCLHACWNIWAWVSIQDSRVKCWLLLASNIKPSGVPSVVDPWHASMLVICIGRSICWGSLFQHGGKLHVI